MMVIILTMLFLSAYTDASSQPFLKKVPESALNLSTGESLKYTRLKTLEIYERVIPVELGDIPTLQMRRNILPVRIPGRQGVILAKPERIEAISEQDFIWYGKFENEDGTITVISVDGEISGHITLNEDAYEILPLSPSIHVLAKVDNAVADNQRCGVETHAEGRDFNYLTDGGDARHHCANLVRVLVVYTTRGQNAITGSVSNFAQARIVEANNILANSGLNNQDLRFELAGVRFWNFTEDVSGDADDADADLDTLQANELADDWRGDYDADIVVALIDANYESGSLVGWAYLEDIGAGGDPDFAHCLVEADAPSNRFTFAHEMAHLFRCRHDVSDPFPNAVPSARGHSFTAGGATRRTVMALAPSSGRIQHFSNPNVNFSGVATGVTSDRDNALQLEDIAPDISDYDTGEPPLAPIISGTTTGNNSTNGSWSVSINHCATATNYKWETSTNGFSYSTVQNGSSNSYAQQLPFDNDLYLRVTVTGGDGDIATAFLTVYNEDAQSCDPCAIMEPVRDSNQPLAIEIVSANPVNGRLTFNLKVLKPGFVQVDLLDTVGKGAQQITNTHLDKGVHQFSVQATNTGTGFQVLRALQKDQVTTKKIIFIR